MHMTNLLGITRSFPVCDTESLACVTSALQGRGRLGPVSSFYFLIYVHSTVGSHLSEHAGTKGHLDNGK